MEAERLLLRRLLRPLERRRTLSRCSRCTSSALRGGSQRKASQRFGSAFDERTRTSLFDSISASVASRMGTAWRPGATDELGRREERLGVDRLVELGEQNGVEIHRRVHRGSGGRSSGGKASRTSTSRPLQRLAGERPRAGRNLHLVVGGHREALGRLGDTRVWVPSQRHSPGGCGTSVGGGGVFASSACDVTATSSCENDTERNGASSTSPSGDQARHRERTRHPTSAEEASCRAAETRR